MVNVVQTWHPSPCIHAHVIRGNLRADYSRRAGTCTRECASACMRARVRTFSCFRALRARPGETGSAVERYVKLGGVRRNEFVFILSCMHMRRQLRVIWEIRGTSVQRFRHEFTPANKERGIRDREPACFRRRDRRCFDAPISIPRIDACSCSSKNNGPRLHCLSDFLELLSVKFGIQSASEKYA